MGVWDLPHIALSLTRSLSLALLFGSSASGQEHEITVQADIFHTHKHGLFTHLPYDLPYITELDLSS